VLVPLMVLLSAFAMWGELLEVNIAINTGEARIDVRDLAVVEGSEFGKSWVASCYANVAESGDGGVGVEIVIENGYPGYTCNVTFSVVNSGTVPLVGPYYSQISVPHGISLYLSPLQREQIHPGEEVEHLVSIGVEQEAGQDSSYTVVIGIEYVQWNEAPPGNGRTTLSGYVFEDLNGDSTWDSGEPPVNGVLVELLLENGSVISSTCTDGYGYYSFQVDPPQLSTYTIKSYSPAGYYFTTPDSITLSVYPGTSNPDNNFGIRIEEPQPGLSVEKEFRETDFSYSENGGCSTNLGTLLPMDGNNYTVYAEVPSSGLYKDKVRSVSPGALYGVIWVEGQGIANISLRDEYDYHFNIGDGDSGRARVYIYNKSSKCIAELKAGRNFTYTIDNTNNSAAVSIRLNKPLEPGQAVLIYLKFKPTDYAEEPNGLIGHPWDSLDKYFENRVYVETNIGSASATGVLEIAKK